MSETVAPTSEFDHATALTAAGAPGHYVGQVSEGFWVQSGPNGGYLAAIALRGATALLDDADRPPRSLHARFLAAPKAGPFELQATVLRAGRSMTTVGVEMRQGERLFLTASACFSAGFSPIEFQDRVMPDARPIGEAEAVPKAIPLNHRWDLWRAIGGEFRKSDRALTGGWIRLAEPRQVDALVLAAIWDAWPPAIFARAMEQRFRGAVPTVEVSVYFRKRLPVAEVAPEQHLLLRVETTHATEGFAEEDAEVWSPDGQLLAQARQLALLI